MCSQINLCSLPSKDDIRCGGVLSYKLPLHETWHIVAIILQNTGNNNELKFIQYNFEKDEWITMGDEYGKSMQLGLCPRNIVIAADKNKIYILNKNLSFDLITFKWNYQSIVPAIWNTSGSSAMYIGYPFNAFHGIFHRDQNYGLRHICITNNNVISTHIDCNKHFKDIEMIYCEWFNRLIVFGGESALRTKNNGNKRAKIVYIPKGRWPEDRNIYYCDITKKTIKNKYKWKKSNQTLKALPNMNIKAIVVFQHIVIIFYRKDGFICVYCWDLITTKRYKSTQCIHFKVCKFRDFKIVKIDETKIHFIDIRNGNHVSISIMDILPTKLVNKCIEYYSYLVCGYIASQSMLNEIDQLIQRYCFMMLNDSIQ